jgi:pyruvate formate lyase activating enzyme
MGGNIMELAQNTVKTQYWHKLEDGRVQCDLCPRHCHLHEGQKGLCFVRSCNQGEVVMTSYGLSSGFCIDPIEKKPLNHYYPGTPVLSFGTAGCNLACKFCQNWDMSKSRDVHTLAQQASPEQLCEAAVATGCRHIAFTYNDPVIFMEYAMDVADCCHQQNINAVAVTAGYICDAPRREFFSHIDAANIDLKAFNEKFYETLCGASLHDTLDTLLYLKHETQVWFEITTLLIPGQNDSDQELDKLSQWIANNLGQDVPLHFSAFHPDWKMSSTPATPHSTLTRARNIAISNGLHYVYTGNVHDTIGSSTYCPNCHKRVIERDWYEIEEWAIDEKGQCQYCHTRINGLFDPQPGKWGSKRQLLQFDLSPN